MSFNSMLHIADEARSRASPVDDANDITTDFTPPVPGDVLGARYRVDTVLARSRGGVVYKAYDTLLRTDVDLRVFGGTLGAELGGGAVRNELARAIGLVHPAIVRMHHVERHPPWGFLVYDHVVGEDMGTRLAASSERRLAPAEVVHIAMVCLEALAYAHARETLHDDIHPAQIIETRDKEIKLAGFGLAALAEMQSGGYARPPGALYLSPARIRGEKPDVRCDLYALASTMFALCTGAPPFGSSIAEAWCGHLELELPHSPLVPVALDVVLRRALAKRADDRFATAEEMRRALRHTLSVLPATNLPATVVLPPLPLPVIEETPPRHASVIRLADRAAQQAERKRSGFFTDRFRRARTLIKDTVDEISRPLRATPEVLLPPPVDPEMVVRQDLRFISPRALTTSDGVVHAMRGFYLGRTPVTNAVYARFLEATGEMPPAHWLGAQPPRMKLDHPVVGVSRASAHRYAQWAGLRLPTGLEWLAAARGPAGDAFPWGSTFDAQRANGPGGRGETTPVDAFAHAATAEGCVDLIGNVWEWTDDDARTPAPDAGFAWVFGGSYCHPCAQGGAIARSSVAVDKEYLYLGFRCALDAGVQA